MSRAQSYLGWGLTAIVAIMPFHAFLSVWAGHLLGHQAIWQGWKEVLILILVALAAQYVWHQPRRLDAIREPVALLIGVFAGIAIIVTALTHPSLRAAAFGLKTDLEFLIIFVIAELVADDALRKRLTTTVLISSAVVIAFGLMQVFLLPRDFLTQFGYGPHTVTPFQIVSPELPAVRILSTLGGPNQLGSFLILPLSIIWWRLLRRPRWWQLIYLLAGGVVLFHTYSRSAWLGLIVSLGVITAMRLPKRWRIAGAIGSLATAAILVSTLLAISGSHKLLQQYLLHQSFSAVPTDGSTNQHAGSLRDGYRLLIAHPFGLGLGAAGPASFHGSHPIIPENYYLQIGIETGFAGLLVFIALQIGLGIKLMRRANIWSAVPLLGTLAGISVVNLFLHGWADSSTALVFWTLAGIAAGERS